MVRHCYVHMSLKLINLIFMSMGIDPLLRFRSKTLTFVSLIVPLLCECHREPGSCPVTLFTVNLQTDTVTWDGSIVSLPCFNESPYSDVNKI